MPFCDLLAGYPGVRLKRGWAYCHQFDNGENTLVAIDSDRVSIERMRMLRGEGIYASA